MIRHSDWQGRCYGILGLGKTGMAAAHSLHRSGAELCIWDDKPDHLAALPAAMAQYVMHYHDWPLARLDGVVVSPGIPLTHPQPHPAIIRAQQHHIRLTSDIELLQQAVPDCRYIAITGTNGKSTTTALIGHVLKQGHHAVEVGGNIGQPALALNALSDEGCYVLELSSFQLDLTRDTTRFQVAVWLNITPDHLDRHGDMAGYIEAKKNIFAQQRAGDLAVIGVDDAYSEAVAREVIAKQAQTVVPISVTHLPDQGVGVIDGVLRDSRDGFAHDLSALVSLRGVHNHQNAATAFAACRAAGMEPESILAAMQSFPGLAHRMQRVKEIGGVLFVNDSKATNADAAARSLGSYERIHWICGGVAKAGGIASLGPFFPRIRHAYLIGASQADFAEQLSTVSHSCYGSLEAAVAAAYRQAEPGDVVLLAPACASFDQFANFETRGEAFCRAVQSIKSEVA